MMFFAHSENESGEKHLLAAHLRDTAKLMASFADNDEIKKIFKITGLLHDFGKYQKDFQSYLSTGGPH
jgi:predicted hydrolase (HD superfamily)